MRPIRVYDTVEWHNWSGLTVGLRVPVNPLEVMDAILLPGKQVRVGFE